MTQPTYDELFDTCKQYDNIIAKLDKVLSDIDKYLLSSESEPIYTTEKIGAIHIIAEIFDGDDIPPVTHELYNKNVDQLFHTTIEKILTDIVGKIYGDN